MKLFDESGNRILTIVDASRLAGVTIRTIQNWIEDQRLNVVGRIDRAQLVGEANLYEAASSYQKTKPRRGLNPASN